MQPTPRGAEHDADEDRRHDEEHRRCGPPDRVDRLIVHQFDARTPIPGGIDTCLRGIARYHSDGTTLAVVGVDAADGGRVGRWDRVDFGSRSIWFLPVLAMNPNDERRKIPHGVRLAAATLRSRRMLPDAEVVQAHRADLVLFLLLLLRRPVSYFIHNQATGLTSPTSDSFWRWLAPVHDLVEGLAVRTAVRTTVFNPDYAGQLQRRGVRAVSAPTWWDPLLVAAGQEESSSPRERVVLWVGRLERPKDPHLAVQAFQALVRHPEGRGWTMRILGDGSLSDDLRDHVSALSEEERPVLLGAVTPERVAAEMRRAHTLLMTSHPGYEGYPRALVEGMASGLIPVVTEGSDTAGLVCEGLGAVTDRDPAAIAAAILSTTGVDRQAVRSAVAHLSAPRVIAERLEL